MASQILLLLWKNWTLQKRKKCVTVFEILMPVSFALLLVLIRSLVKRENIDHITTFPPLDATGVKFDIRILEKPMLLYTPKDAVINNIMNDTLQFLPDQPTINGSIPIPWTLVPFDNIDDLLNFYKLYYKNVWAAVQFDKSSSNGVTLSKNVHYSLRVSPKDSDSTWRTDNTYPFFQSPGYRNDEADGGTPDYYTTGFLALQVAVDKAITLHFNSSARFDDIDLKIEKMPYPPFIKDNFLTVLQQNFPLLLVLGFILAALQTTKSIVYEKEKKLKEAMKLMGMNSFLYWVSWLIKDLIYLLIVIALYTVLFKISIGEKGKILPNSDASLMFVFLLCYILSILAFCFMVSTFFNKANAGAFAGGALFYAFYIPYYFLQSRYETMSRGEKMGTCILNNMGMAFGLNTVGLYEGTGEGAKWSNFHKPATVDDNFSLLDAMLMLIIDTVVYLLITWYVDGVHPGEYGVPLPWYFPFSKTYWCGQPRSRRSGSFAASSQNENNFERDPTGLEVGISISHLRKVFGSGKKKKIAVANTSINMYEGQITALLGHNGAGKTTTMSMLTGFLPPTSGTANVNGYDIVDNITGVRKSLGLCPQHNILFDTMTVEEHLYFYAKLKGCPTNQVQKEIDDMIKVLDLEAKRHRFSMTLSGGQKRKLSVGIALIAGSKIVILDEPTSGMDPAARRQTWDILQSFKKERTLVLSTHFMDEADLLGDRIAIMAEGVVKCCGSSLFLKKLYGAGYHLIIVKGKDCDVGKLTSLIQSHIATAEIESEISAELSYLLPFNETAKFENMFLDIENKSQELGITSFGTSATTMEEVFLKVGDANVEEEEEEMNDVSVDGIPNPNYGSTFDKSKNGDLSASANGIPNGKTQTEDISLNLKDHESYIGFNSVVTKNVGLILTYQQFCGMFMKKLLHTWRNRTVTLVQTILPVLFVIMALTVEKTLPKVKDDPALPLDLHMFDDVKVIVNTGINATTMSQTLGDQYSNVLKKENHQIVKYPSSQYDNITQYLVETSKQVGLNVFKKQYILAGDFEPISDTQVNATAVFNGEPFHAVAISLTYMLDSMLKYFTDDSHSISTTNFPFPRPIEDSSRGFGYATRGTGFSIAFTVLFGMAFLSTSFIIFLIKERSTGAKHLQKVSGVSAMSYWFSNFVWDLINYIVPVLLILICFAAFQTDAYTDDSRLGLIFLCFMLYGWACLPSVYIFHYLFKTPASGMVMVSLLNIVTGLATMMAVFIIEIPDLDIPEAVGTSLDWIFTIFLPNHCLGQSLLYIYTNYGYKEVCITAQYEMACGNPNITYHPCCRDKCTSNCFFFEDNYLSLTTPGSGRYVLFMAAQGFLYFTVVFMIEYGIFERIFYSCKSTTSHSVASLSRQQSMYDPDNEDSDVQDEKKRINDSDLQRLLHTDSIVLKDICKNYDHFRAVKGVSVGIPKQECFGLLGQNGAGKTSVFKMLTGDQMVTSGNAYLNTYDVQQHMIQVQQNIGYCPQFDALIDQMTGRETLTMYARLRGVKENLIKNVVNELLDIMMLRKYADRQCGTYSGGNKRKLSTAIALVGDPPFILLDEPTTGMDPAARRKLWNVLSQIRASGRTLILTSHSMEECDALCTKIAIMVNGRFVCLGSSQHLKNKYGHGYTLIVRIGIDENGMPAHTEPLKEFITSTFPDSQIFDDHQGYLHFQIPDASIPLASVFGAMEKAKERLNIEDYSVHQTTLEQVFLTFTKNQHPPKEDKKGFFSSLVCCR